MRTKDIKKIIRQEIESHISKTAPIIDFPFEKEVPLTKAHQPRVLTLKHSLNAVLAVMVLVLAISFLFRNPTGPTPPVTTKLLNSDSEIVSFSAVSSVSLMSILQQTDLQLSGGIQLNVNRPSAADMVMPYLKSIEQLMSTEGMHVTEGLSSLPEYEAYMMFETKNLLDQTTVYEMHYNMTLLEDDGEESEYDLDGILIRGINTYEVSGRKEIEEGEEKVIFKAFLDENNYVESLYKIEEDEQTFRFKAVENDIVISESKFDLEVDDDEIKVDLEFIEGDIEGSYVFEYKDEDGSKTIAIEYEINVDGEEMSGEMSVSMVVDDITGEVIYRFSIRPNDDDAFEYDIEDDDEDEEDEEDDDEDEEDEEDDEEEEDIDEEETEKDQEDKEKEDEDEQEDEEQEDNDDLDHTPGKDF